MCIVDCERRSINQNQHFDQSRLETSKEGKRIPAARLSGSGPRIADQELGEPEGRRSAPPPRALILFLNHSLERPPRPRPP